MRITNKLVNALSLFVLLGSIFSNTLMEKSIGPKVLEYVMIWILALILIWRHNNLTNFSIVLSIYALSLSSMLSISLISQYPYGVDICKEYYVSTEVLKHSFWQPSNDAYFSVSTLVFTVPMLNVITGINLLFIYKFILILIVALIALTLYYIYTSLHFTREISMLALLLVMSSAGYGGLTGGLRESVSYLQFYIILLFILRFLLRETQVQRARTWSVLILLLVGFGIMHYTFLYMVLTTLIMSVLIYFLMPSFLTGIPWFMRVKNSLMKVFLTAILLLLIIRFLWDCLNTTNIESALNVLLKALSELTEPTSQPHASLVASISPQLDIVSTVLVWSLNILRALMVVGVVYCIVAEKSKSDHIQYTTFYHFICLSSILILTGTFLNRPLGWAIESSRTYYFTLFLIAPFYYYGNALLKLILRTILQTSSVRKISRVLDKALPILIALSITSSWLYSPLLTFFGFKADHRVLTPYTVSPSKEFLVETRSYISAGEIASAEWINTYGYSLKRVIADFHGRSRLWIAHMHPDKIVIAPTETRTLNQDIMYLRRDNFMYGYITVVPTLGLIDYATVNYLWEKCSLIYNNGVSGVIYSSTQYSLLS